MAITNGQKVTGFTNGTAVTAQVTAVANSDGASYNSPASAKSSAAKPYGAPGKPSASGKGQSGETNNPQVTLSWGPPNTATHDVAKLQINIDGKGWENVAIRAGSRTLNVNHDSSHSIKVRAANSRGDFGSVASASARAGSKPKPKPPTSWKLTVGGSGTTLESRSCMEYRNSLGDNYGGPGDCKGNHWSYPGDSITATCYIVSGSNRWYYQQSGSREINNGLLIRGDHVREAGGGGHLNGGAPAGMGKC
jgi:hypothetical protein